MKSSKKLSDVIIGAIIGAVGVIIAAIITGIFPLLREEHTSLTPPAVTATTFSPTATATTITSIRGPTATPQAYATATASAIAANPDPYGADGKLALNDPLQDNSHGYGWDEKGNNTGGDCKFTASGYDVLQSDLDYFNVCFAESTSFSNFAYEVQMTIIKGDAGGLLFRGSSAGTGSFYYFNIFQDGHYEVTFCPPNNGNCTDIVTPTVSDAIKQGLNQTNLLAVVANGPTFTIYVNHQKVTSFKNGDASQGQIGMVASPLATNGHPTEVVYTNAKVWTF